MPGEVGLLNASMGTDRIVVRQAGDADRFRATDDFVWSVEDEADWSTDASLHDLPESGRFAADIEGQELALHAGVYAVRPMQLTVPGGRSPVPVAGLTYVGVHPDVRRRGVLTAMMRDHLDRCRDDGLVVSVLHASETGIYSRFGYGLAATELRVTLGSGTTLTAPGLEADARAVTTETVSASDPGVIERLMDCERACAAEAPGTVTAELPYYQAFAQPPPSYRRGSEPLRLVFARKDGHDIGVAWFRRRQEWPQGRAAGTLTASVMSGSPVARLVILRRLLEADLMGKVVLGRVGIDDPLFGWVDGPRGVSEAQASDNTWVRLADLPRALGLRSYAADCDVVVEVQDAYVRDNAGRWRLRVRDGRLSVDGVDAGPDLTMDVARLGAAYLGAGNLVAQRRAGLIEEHRAGAAAELWHAMRTDVAPSPSMGF